MNLGSEGDNLIDVWIEAADLRYARITGKPASECCHASCVSLREPPRGILRVLWPRQS